MPWSQALKSDENYFDADGHKPIMIATIYIYVLKTCRITFLNIRNVMLPKALNNLNIKGFSRDITFLLPECYTEFWQYN